MCVSDIRCLKSCTGLETQLVMTRVFELCVSQTSGVLRAVLVSRVETKTEIFKTETKYCLQTRQYPCLKVLAAGSGKLVTYKSSFYQLVQSSKLCADRLLVEFITHNTSQLIITNFSYSKIINKLLFTRENPNFNLIKILTCKY